MKKWLPLCALCLLALLFPGANLYCWDTAGDRAGSWSETSCDGNENAGSWTGYVTNACRFIGTNEWENVVGTINPSTRILTAAGTGHNECGALALTGTFNHTWDTITGSYVYSEGGGGKFTGITQPYK